MCLPDLYPENEQAANIFKLVHDQVRTSATGKILGLDMNIVVAVMRQLEVEDFIDCIGKVKMLTNHFIRKK